MHLPSRNMPLRRTLHHGRGDGATVAQGTGCSSAATRARNIAFNVISLNLNGAQSPGAFARLCTAVSAWTRKLELAAVCCQEHNLDPADRRDHERLASLRGLQLHIAYSKPGSGPGTHWGGSLSS